MTRMPSSVPDLRVRKLGQTSVNNDGDYVLYWMTSARRTQWNFALQRACDWAEQLNKPVVVFEPLRCGYQWASDRFHAFVVDGMRDNAAACEKKGVSYLPYLEPTPDAGKGLLSALAKNACVVVGDDFPAFFLRRMVEAAATQINCHYELVDSNGLLPLASSERAAPTAYVFRRFLQKNIPAHLDVFPKSNPLQQLTPRPAPALPKAWGTRWRPARLANKAPWSKLPIDHQVAPTTTVGGATAATKMMKAFLEHGLDRYHEERNQIDDSAASGLSPWLHFGHISAHQIVSHILTAHDWHKENLAESTNGKREGWWGLPPGPESFFDELITWREVGYHYCHHRPDHEQYDDLPTWAQTTLEQHALDPREYVYALTQFANAQTHDPLWNAAQRELRVTGRMHNYLRMLWGKKILEWSKHPRDAYIIVTELNNRYALDGRDPNSSSGISWCFGRFDRPWAPERKIFGQIRFMSSASTMKKLRVKSYLAKWSGEQTWWA